jgi:ABC-type uncharacterized transport system auxiliary subunit
LLVLYSAAGLDACSGSLFHSRSPPTTVYLLSADPGPAALLGQPALAADVAVLRPRVRAGLETDRIAVLYPDHRLDYFADVRWSGPLDLLVQDLALQALRTGARLRNVSADASAFSSAYWLELDVVDFEADYTATSTAPVVRVHLIARLGLAGDRRILADFESDVTRQASADRLTPIVDAYQQAVTAALAEVVNGITRTIKPVS